MYNVYSVVLNIYNLYSVVLNICICKCIFSCTKHMRMNNVNSVVLNIRSYLKIEPL